MSGESQFEQSYDRIANLALKVGRFISETQIGLGAIVASIGAVEYFSGLDHDLGEGLLIVGSAVGTAGYLFLKLFDWGREPRPGQQGPSTVE